MRRGIRTFSPASLMQRKTFLLFPALQKIHQASILEELRDATCTTPLIPNTNCYGPNPHQHAVPPESGKTAAYNPAVNGSYQPQAAAAAINGSCDTGAAAGASARGAAAAASGMSSSNTLLHSMVDSAEMSPSFILHLVKCKPGKLQLFCRGNFFSGI